jgi:hypothetical protein
LSSVSADPYRAPLPIEPDPYVVAWGDLKKRKRFEVVGRCLVFGAPLIRLFFASGPPRWLAFFGAFLVALPFTLPTASFRCPKCGERMFRWWGAKASDAKHCRHCGIAIGTPKSGLDRAPEPLPLTQSMRVAADVSAQEIEASEEAPPPISPILISP